MRNVRVLIIVFNIGVLVNIVVFYISMLLIPIGIICVILVLVGWDIRMWHISVRAVIVWPIPMRYRGFCQALFFWRG